MKNRVSLGAALALVLLSACHHATPAVSTTTPQSALTEVPPPPPPPQPPRETSSAFTLETADPIFGMDITAVTLDAKQRTRVDAIQTELRMTTAKVRNAQRELLASMAQNLDATGERAAVDVQLRQVAAAAQQSKAAIANAYNELHEVLRPDQRVKVRGVFSVGWEISSPRATPGAGLGPLPSVAADLGLTGDQLHAAEARLQAARPDPFLPTHEDHAKHRAVMQAFRSASFDAVGLGVGDGFVRAARAFAQRASDIVDALAPDLTPPQRAHLSAILRAKAQH